MAKDVCIFRRMVHLEYDVRSSRYRFQMQSITWVKIVMDVHEMKVPSLIGPINLFWSSFYVDLIMKSRSKSFEKLKWVNFWSRGEGGAVADKSKFSVELEKVTRIIKYLLCFVLETIFMINWISFVLNGITVGRVVENNKHYVMAS